MLKDASHFVLTISVYLVQVQHRLDHLQIQQSETHNSLTFHQGDIRVHDNRPFLLTVNDEFGSRRRDLLEAILQGSAYPRFCGKPDALVCASFSENASFT